MLVTQIGIEILDEQLQELENIDAEYDLAHAVRFEVTETCYFLEIRSASQSYQARGRICKIMLVFTWPRIRCFAATVVWPGQCWP